MARPFVKWAGGKTQLLAELLDVAPAQIETYYEPFLGGGALFFALQAQGRFKRAVLADSNEELINAYTHVRDHLEQLIHALRVHERKYRSREAEARAEYFYTIRGKRLTCDLGGAANLIFLNKTCFNGLYRVNSSGGFNVPHGRYANPMICDEKNLRAASEALSTVELRVGDFAEAAAEAGTGDFVYFDPPYVPLSATANFTSYTSQAFHLADQQRLASTAESLARQGAAVALSNSGHPDVASLYRSEAFVLAVVAARRAINSDSSGRQPVAEYLIRAG